MTDPLTPKCPDCQSEIMQHAMHDCEWERPKWYVDLAGRRVPVGFTYEQIQEWAKTGKPVEEWE